jgi:hypothetical protein
VFVAAFGHRMDVTGLVVAYGFANVLAVIPVTPGRPRRRRGCARPDPRRVRRAQRVAILGVISWRLVQFWLPIPAGAAAYVSLRVTAPEKIDGDLAAAKAAVSPPS